VLAHERALPDQLLMFRACSRLLLISTAAFLVACWGGASREMLATVLFVDGKVTYEVNRQHNLQALTLQTNPGPGAVVRTSGDGRVALALVPGALLEISANSEVKIEELLLNKNGNETEDGMRKRVARIRLNAGSITAIFERRDASELRFAIATARITVTVDDNCVSHVRVDGDKTRVTCARGKAYVSTGSSEPVTLKAGYFQQWPNGSPVATSEDATGQSDVADALETEAKLQQLYREQFNRRPF
jgi:hypothetical protein